MKRLKMKLTGQSKYWWIVLCTGILMVFGGFAYWFWPGAGYATASMIFGWLLVLTGTVQLCVSCGKHRPRYWGLWLIGGMLNIFVGFVLVRNIVLSELILPYFLALIFIFRGIESIINSTHRHHQRYWWVHLVNGIIMLFIGYLFLEAGYIQDMLMVSLLAAIGFIYWGFTLAMTAFEMRPCCCSSTESNCPKASN